MFLLNNKIYIPVMIYLHLQNRLKSNNHCSTYYNKLLYVCVGGRDIVNCLLILQLSYL